MIWRRLCLPRPRVPQFHMDQLLSYQTKGILQLAQTTATNAETILKCRNMETNKDNTTKNNNTTRTTQLQLRLTVDSSPFVIRTSNHSSIEEYNRVIPQRTRTVRFLSTTATIPRNSTTTMEETVEMAPTGIDSWADHVTSPTSPMSWGFLPSFTDSWQSAYSEPESTLCYYDSNGEWNLEYFDNSSTWR